MKGEVLVAGVGNVFLADDGFGPAVAAHLMSTGALAGEARVVDYGIRGLHLAYDLAEPWERVVIIDAAPRGDAPGTLSLMVPDVEPSAARGANTGIDAHRFDLGAVLATVGAWGGRTDRVLLVACEPAEICERMTLSATVESVVAAAADVVVDAVRRPFPEGTGHERGRTTCSGG